MVNIQHKEMTATPAAIAHIQQMIAKRGSGVGVRLSLKNKGCSGKSYVMALIDHLEEIKPDDHVYQLCENLRLCVDAESFAAVAGTIIDYVNKGVEGSRFVYHNPNEKASCGCGESFYV